MSRIAFVIGLLVLGGALLVVPSSAQAQLADIEIIWGHTTPNAVVRFEVYASRTRGDLAGAREVWSGKTPSHDIVDGEHRYRLGIEVDPLEYVAVAAVALDGSKSLSEWSSLPPSTPGQPFYIP